MDAQSGAVAGFDSGAGGAIAKGKKGVLGDFAGGRLNGNDRILQFRDAATFSELPRGSCDCFRRQPGFVLAEARHGDYLVGFAAGMPLRPSTSWWKDLTNPLPAEVTTEHPGRTFALTELLVRASWRRQGIAGSLHDLLLDGRPEERATLAVPPGATAAQNAFRKWGWIRVARTHGPHHGSPVLDVLIIALPASRR